VSIFSRQIKSFRAKKIDEVLFEIRGTDLDEAEKR